MYCEINKYSHHFTVTKVKPVMHEALKDFYMKLVSFELKKQGRRWFRVPGKLYCTRSNKGTVYRFHINHLKDFLLHLRFKGFNEGLIDIHQRRVHTPEEVDLVVKEKWQVRDTQVPIVDYLADPGNIKVVTLQMGQGKTFCALYAAAQEGTRLMIQVLARFTGKWFEDVKKTYDIEDKKILQIRGLKALMKFMKKYEDQPHRHQYDVYIISTNTWIDYIKDYEKNHSTKRPKWYVPPENFAKVFGIGQKIIDEVHMHFHWNFKVSLYDNIPKVVYLSATLDDLDSDLDIKMYNTLLPKELRRDGGVRKVYTNVYEIEYAVRNADKLRYKGDKGQYSHVVFENSVRRNKELYPQYLEMIRHEIDTYYMLRRTEGQKVLTFFGLTEMCADFRDLMSAKYPDLTHVKYTSEDDIETLDTADSIASTLGSSGTAIDIPDLLVCALTVGLNKSQTNLQAFGRLRDLGDKSEEAPTFLFFTCIEIDKHKEYSNKKYSLLRSRAKLIQSTIHKRILVA